MPKQWWSSRSMLLAQTACLLGLVGWSVHRNPGESTKVQNPSLAPRETGAVIDNSDDTAAVENLGAVDARFVAPPRVNFRTQDTDDGGSLNLRPIETHRPAEREDWQPVHPQNPPRRAAPSGPRSPFEVNGNGATVYNPPPPDEE